MKIRSSPCQQQHHGSEPASLLVYKLLLFPTQVLPGPALHRKARRTQVHTTLLHTQHPFPRPDILPKGWAGPCPTCSWWRVRSKWLLKGKAAVCLPVVTCGCWEKDRVSGSYCNTLPVGEGPRLISLSWHCCARLCRFALQPSQALRPPACTLTMMVTHPSSQSTSALRLSHWGQGTRPLSRGRDSLSGLASPGVTHAQRRRGVMDLPTQESQPPLCTIVSGYTGAERCLVSL